MTASILQQAQDTGLISAQDLNTLLQNGTPIRLVDASYNLSLTGQHDPYTVYNSVRIADAAYFDIDDIADHNSDLPHMLPDESTFGAKIGALGISNDDFVICYDQTGISFAASRAWWMFRAFGHNKVAVLDGGLRNWLTQNFLGITTPPEQPIAKNFKATLNKGLVKSLDDIANPGGSLILDARPAERFSGKAPEPRPGMKSGHMPGAKNLPFQTLLTPSTGTLRPESDVNPVLTSLGLKPETTIITTCGSGVTACVVTLALYRAGLKNVAVYDGSWAEWGRSELNTPVAKI